MRNEELRKIPGVDRLLNDSRLAVLIDRYGEPTVVDAIRQTIDVARKQILGGHDAPLVATLVDLVCERIRAIDRGSLKPVINATGIILHTNLGRAPLGRAVLEALEPIARGYSNLELDMSTGKRGSRHSHLADLLSFVTGAEDALVVNNNAAAVLLSLDALASGAEVIVSRGELIEIGGSFRMPDIMKSSGANMVEVGTTNRTRIEDYEQAITPRTKVLFKAHKSNFHMQGFTEEASIRQLAELARSRGLIAVYDLGSGLLRRPKHLDLGREPDVRGALQDGADVVTFSGDKLLGGPQAGVIVGRAEVVSRLAKHPLTRALRVGKMTLSALSAVVSCYLNETIATTRVPIFSLLNRTPNEVRTLAQRLQAELTAQGIDAEVVESTARSGGGTLPDLEIPSYAVHLRPPPNHKRFAEETHLALLALGRPVLGVLREGSLLLDLASVFEDEVSTIARSVRDAM